MNPRKQRCTIDQVLAAVLHHPTCPEEFLKKGQRFLLEMGHETLDTPPDLDSVLQTMH